MKTRLTILSTRAATATAAVCVLALAGCNRGDQTLASAPASSDGQAGYAAPPLIQSAQRIGDQVVISGTADAGGRLRLQAPEGDAFGGTTGADGTWAMPAPTDGRPRLYAVGEDLGGSILRADAVVAALPSGRPAALLRAGVGSLVLGPLGTAPQIEAVDYDAGGWAFVSVHGRPDEPLKLLVDGRPVADIKANSRGHFDQALKPADLSAGVHQLQLLSSSGAGEAQITVSPAPDLGGRPYLARRQGAAWRIDWKTPGGGVQTSVIPDP